jgi:NADH:ubiquinone oxidoreductase subunit 4 (subunit M)
MYILGTNILFLLFIMTFARTFVPCLIILYIFITYNRKIHGAELFLYTMYHSHFIRLISINFYNTFHMP